MRKLKRDKQQRAYTKGYHAGVAGRSRDLAPEGNTQHSWLSGWREGRSDMFDGYTGVSGVHKLPI